MTTPLFRLTTLAAVLLMGGCAATDAYLGAKRNTAEGGQQQRDIATAKTDLQNAQGQNARLAADKQRIQAEINSNNQRVAALQGDLRKQDNALATALKAKKLTQARYDDMKKQLDGMRDEAQSLAAANPALGGTDPKADAAKETRLRDLERRKKELDSTLSTLASP